MKKYNVYGIGNALVDKEFEVNEDFFARAGIEKGFMTLIDQEKQEELLNTLMAEYGLRKRAGGGSAANTLYALSQFGGRAYFSSKVADDEPGAFYVRALGDLNIETNLADSREPGSTGRCLVMITPDAERTMLTCLGISEKVSTSELDHDAVRNSDYAYIEGYLVTSPSALEAIIRLKRVAEENGVKTALTLSDPAMAEHFREAIDRVLGETGVDLLFCNEKEALLWSGESELEQATRRLEKVARQFVVTRGARGALLYDGNGYIGLPAHPVKAVDSNGAGDMFAGAFLYGLTNGMDFETSGRLAGLASATIVSSFGPRLEPQQHQEILQELRQSAPGVENSA